MRNWLQMSERLNSIIEKVVIILMFIVTLLTTVGVFSRYLFGVPIVWLYELTLVFFVWTIFLGCSVAFKRQEHIYLDFVLSRLSGTPGRLFAMLLNLVTVLFLLICIVEGWQIVKDTSTQNYLTIDLPTAWFYAALPASFGISLIHVTGQLLLLARPGEAR
jgi:TRAP-type C4-dicarboxylate transport system permease small subunit